MSVYSHVWKFVENTDIKIFELLTCEWNYLKREIIRKILYYAFGICSKFRIFYSQINNRSFHCRVPKLYLNPIYCLLWQNLFSCKCVSVFRLRSLMNVNLIRPPNFLNFILLLTLKVCERNARYLQNYTQTWHV